MPGIPEPLRRLGFGAPNQSHLSRGTNPHSESRDPNLFTKPSEPQKKRMGNQPLEFALCLLKPMGKHGSSSDRFPLRLAEENNGCLNKHMEEAWRHTAGYIVVVHWGHSQRCGKYFRDLQPWLWWVLRTLVYWLRVSREFHLTRCSGSGCQNMVYFLGLTPTCGKRTAHARFSSTLSIRSECFSIPASCLGTTHPVVRAGETNPAEGTTMYCMAIQQATHSC